MRFSGETASRPRIIAHDVEPHLRATLEAFLFKEAEEAFVLTLPADSGRVDEVVATWERDGEQMVRQFAGELPVPWEDALATFIDWVDGTGIWWFLLGSAALAARGLDVTPRDVDLATDEAGAFALGDLFAERLAWPVSDTGGWPVCRWFGRVFWHARIEIAGAIRPSIDRPRPRPWGPIGVSRLERIHWRSREMLVASLDLQLEDERARGRTAYANEIKRALGRR